MRVLVVEPKKSPMVKEISGSLEDLQKEVGGYIEAVPLSENVCMILNEEGKLLGLPPNRILVDAYKGDMIDKIVGKIVVVGTEGENFRSLTADEIAQETERFAMDYVLLGRRYA